jgi:hypothetical protein
VGEWVAGRQLLALSCLSSLDGKSRYKKTPSLKSVIFARVFPEVSPAISVVHGAVAPAATHETSAALTIVIASVSEAIQGGDG